MGVEIGPSTVSQIDGEWKSQETEFDRFHNGLRIPASNRWAARIHQQTQGGPSRPSSPP
jgi:hypothetical protein